ncbi:NAD(P)-binding domain-containing protein [Streptomyces sp. NPDC050509]|uniref:RraA family protein n=1 Tax=Streptomyces sp. NPDC050509 TaxID=3365620 RepID=UPI003792B36A
MRASVLGLGEAGSLYSAGLVERGWTVTGYDPADNVTPDGVRRAGTPEAAVRDADVVLSLVGGRAAEPAAQSVAAFLARGSVYADMNTTDPAAKRRIAASVGDDRFADVSVIGSVPEYGAATAVVISGAGSPPAARLFAALGARVEDIAGAPGDASARKLLRSTFMKGLGALIVESSAAGRAAGAEEWVRTQIVNELAGGEAALDRLYEGTLRHAARRAGESAAAAELLDSLGRRPVMTRAAAEAHQALADAALMPDEELLAGFSGLAVANIGDARDRMGMLDGGIRALWKGARLVGRARTVWVRSGDNQALHRAIRISRPGDVLVVNGQGDTTRALLGELMAERAKRRGVVGIVVDGALRDIGELEAIGFAAWARAVTPAGPYKNGPGQVDVPVAVGGVVVRPGDLVVADDDGVIVVPAAEAAASLLGGRAVATDEARRRAAILAGTA